MWCILLLYCVFYQLFSKFKTKSNTTYKRFLTTKIIDSQFWNSFRCCNCWNLKSFKKSWISIQTNKQTKIVLLQHHQLKHRVLVWPLNCVTIEQYSFCQHSLCPTITLESVELLFLFIFLLIIIIFKKIKLFSAKRKILIIERKNNNNQL